MREFIDLDDLERKAQAAQAKGTMFGVTPEAMIQLIAMLRGEGTVCANLEAVTGPGGAILEALDARTAEVLGRCRDKLKEAEASAGRILENLETPIDVCSCDESLALRAKLDRYERAEPNGAMQRLRKFLLDVVGCDLSGDTDEDAALLQQGRDAADEVHRWMVTIERRALDAETRLAALKLRPVSEAPRQQRLLFLTSEGLDLGSRDCRYRQWWGHSRAVPDNEVLGWLPLPAVLDALKQDTEHRAKTGKADG